MLSLILCAVLSQSPEPKRVIPLQFDLAAVAGLGQRSAAGFALYLGAAVGPARPPWGAPFGSVGFEFVQQFGKVPFRASWGLQLRAGYAWSSDARMSELVPDVLVYARATPFWGSDVGLASLSPQPELSQGTVRRSGIFGFRLGVGVTAPWWTRTLLFLHPFTSERGFAGETLKVLSTLLLTPLAFFNHLELVAELVGVEDSTLTVRIGGGL